MLFEPCESSSLRLWTICGWTQNKQNFVPPGNTQWWTAGHEQCSSLRFDVYLVHTKKVFWVVFGKTKTTAGCSRIGPCYYFAHLLRKVLFGTYGQKSVPPPLYELWRHSYNITLFTEYCLGYDLNMSVGLKVDLKVIVVRCLVRTTTYCAINR